MGSLEIWISPKSGSGVELGRQGLNLLLRLRGEGGGKLVRGEEGKELTNRIDSIPVFLNACPFCFGNKANVALSTVLCSLYKTFTIYCALELDLILK